MGMISGIISLFAIYLKQMRCKSGEEKLLKKMILLVLIMAMAVVLCSAEDFKNLLDSKIPDSKTSLLRDWQSIYDNQNFSLRTLINRKFHDGKNHFAIRDFYYRGNLQDDLKTIKRFEDIYETTFEEQQRVFISVILANDKRMVYEVNDKGHQRWLRAFLARSAPGTIPPDDKKDQQRISALEKEIENYQKVIKKKDREIKALEEKAPGEATVGLFGLIEEREFIIIIIFLLLVMFGLIYSLWLNKKIMSKYKDDLEKEKPDNRELRNKLKTVQTDISKFEKENNGLQKEKEALLNLLNVKKKMYNELKIEKNNLEKEKAARDTNERNRVPGSGTLNEEIRWTIGAILERRIPVGQEMEALSELKRYVEASVSQFKDNQAKLKYYQNFLGIDKHNTENEISNVHSRLENYKKVTELLGSEEEIVGRIKDLLSKIGFLSKLIAALRQETGISIDESGTGFDLLQEDIREMKRKLSVKSIVQHRELICFLSDIAAKNRDDEEYRESKLYRKFWISVSDSVFKCRESIDSNPDTTLEEFMKTNRTSMLNIYKEFYKYYMFLQGVMKINSSDELKQRYYWDKGVFEHLHSLLDAFNRSEDAGIQVEAAVPFHDTFTESNQQRASVFEIEEVEYVLKHHTPVAGTVLEVQQPIIRSDKLTDFFIKLMYVYCK
jgi:hypothetical protein